MNQTQALNKLRKVLGDKLGYRIDKQAPDAERREIVRAEYHAAKRASDAAEAARKLRYEELLKDAEYQALKTAAQVAKAAAEKTQGELFRHRITVGTSGDMFFHVKADGDNWDEVVEKVCAKATA